MKETLYKRNTNGSVQEWTIETSGNEYWTIYGQVGGKLITSEPTVCVGKNIGKKNETTPEDQAILEAVSAINKKTSKEHYFKNINDIDCQVFIKPMLAHKLRDHKNKVRFPVYLDFKLDGCLSYDSLVEIEGIGAIPIGAVVEEKISGKIKSYDPINNEVVWCEISDWLTGLENLDGEDYEWLEVELENGNKIKLTANHRVWMPDLGVWREAGLLEVGDDLLQI